MHTRFTGHANFVDKVSPKRHMLQRKCLCGAVPHAFLLRTAVQTDDVKTLDTEKEMKVAQMEVDGKEDASASGAAEGDTVEEKVGGMHATLNKCACADLLSPVCVQLWSALLWCLCQAPPVVDEAMLKELEAMGFSVNKATRALHFSGSNTVEGAVNWLMEHEGDADLDEPLLVPKVGLAPAVTSADPSRAKLVHDARQTVMARQLSLCVISLFCLQSSADSGPKLSPEEARKKAEDLVRKAKEKREREEKEAEVSVRDAV